MAERIPPHDLEAERTALGSILLRPEDALPNVMDHAGATDFYDPKHKEIFLAIRSLAEKNSPIDIITVSDELKLRGTLKTVGGRAYVSSLSTDVPSTSNAGEYAKIIHGKAVLRNLIDIANDIQAQCFQGKVVPEAVLEFAEKSIFEIATTRQKKDYAFIRDVLLNNIERIDEAGRMEGMVGLQTGFTALDDLIGGLQKSTLNILAARPGMGKTALALNIANYVSGKMGKSTLIFSLEMAKEELGSRIHSMEANVESDKMKSGRLSDPDWDSLNKALDDLGDAKLAIDETAAITLMEMKNKCRRFKAKHGLDLVVVDYLQLMEADGENRQQEVSKLSRNLKLMAKEMDCPFLVLSQLSRGPEARTDKRPLLSDLRESGSIEQDADIVMFLYNDEYYNKETEEKGITEVHVAKHRAGPTGTVKLTWVARFTKFANMMGDIK